MFHVAGMNPWLAMWSQPRSTIRALVHNRPSYGIFSLATIFVLQSILYYANWWSLGLQNDSYTILLVGLILSPFVGCIWLYSVSWIFYLTGRLFRGICSAQHLRAAIAWSKVPMTLSLLMWVILLAFHPDVLFIQDGGGPSSLFINLITFILVLWSFILLIQSIRELQHFTLRRAIANVVVSLTLSRALFFFVCLAARYLYLSLAV